MGKLLLPLSWSWARIKQSPWNISKSWTQTLDGTKETLRKPYTLLPRNQSWTRIWDTTHSRRLTGNWSSHVIWDRPLGRYPGHVTRPAKRQPAITNISAEERLLGWDTKIPWEFLWLLVRNCQNLLQYYVHSDLFIWLMVKGSKVKKVQLWSRNGRT